MRKLKIKPSSCLGNVHYCGKYSHIKLCCYRMYGYPKDPTQPKANHVMIKTRKEWIPKVFYTRLIAHTSLRASSRED